MTARPPDFDELVGELEAEEREQLRGAHELLVAAGPAPELPPRLSAPPEVARLASPRARPRGRMLALAAALAVTAFALGVAVGDRDGVGTFDVVTMRGTAAAAEARGSVELFDADAAGNWPMELRVEGLRPSARERPYELWVVRDGAQYALCGSFLVDAHGAAVVPMNAPYDLRELDAWVVVERGSDDVLLST